MCNIDFASNDQLLIYQQSLPISGISLQNHMESHLLLRLILLVLLIECVMQHFWTNLHLLSFVRVLLTPFPCEASSHHKNNYGINTNHIMTLCTLPSNFDTLYIKSFWNKNRILIHRDLENINHYKKDIAFQLIKPTNKNKTNNSRK